MAHARPTPTWKVPGGTIAYDVAGEGPPIVLLHEGIADRRMWDHEMSRLANKHRVVRFDFRGFGGSTPAEGPFSYVDDLAAVVNGLGLTRPVLVGPSMGGVIVLDYALDHPTSPCGLFLVAPGPPSGLQPGMIPEGKAAFEADERSSQAIAAAWAAGETAHAFELLRRLWCPALRGAALEKFRAMVTANALEVFEDRSARLCAPPKAPAVPRLASLDLPVEIVVGDQDNPAQPYFAGYLGRSIPGARVVSIPGADHLVNLSQPDAFAAALDDFLARVDA